MFWLCSVRLLSKIRRFLDNKYGMLTACAEINLFILGTFCV